MAELFDRMKELNLPTGKLWMLREEKKGRLKINRAPNGWRWLTEKDIERIIDQYSPHERIQTTQ